MSIVFDSQSKAMLLTVLKDPKIPHDERRVYNTGIIGSGVAYSLPLPNERVAFPEQHYDQQYAQVTKEFISALHEEVMIDLMATIDITKQIWLNRYAACYIPSTKEAVNLAIKVLSNSKPYDIGDSPAGEAMAVPTGATVPAASFVPQDSLAVVDDTQPTLTLESYLAKHVDQFVYIASDKMKRK